MRKLRDAAIAFAEMLAMVYVFVAAIWAAMVVLGVAHMLLF